MAGPPIDVADRRAPPSPTRRPIQESLGFSDDSPPAIANVCHQTRRAIERLRPPVKAHGGKYYLAREIVPILLSVRERITEYLEPCAFGASVFLAMPRLEREILGDTNPEVCALWTVLGNERLAAALTERRSRLPYNEATTFSACRRVICSTRACVGQSDFGTRIIRASRLHRSSVRG